MSSCSSYHSKYCSFFPASAQDSELQSLSSDAQIDDTMSVLVQDGSNVDYPIYSPTKHKRPQKVKPKRRQKVLNHQNIPIYNAKDRLYLGNFIPRTQRLPTPKPLSQEEFYDAVVKALNKVIEERKEMEEFSEKLYTVEEYCSRRTLNEMDRLCEGIKDCTENIRNASTIIKEEEDCTEDIRNASTIIKEEEDSTEDIRNASTIIKEEEDCTEDIRNASTIIKEEEDCIEDIRDASTIIKEDEDCIEDIRNASTIIKEDEDCTEDIMNASTIIKEDEDCIEDIMNASTIIKEDEDCTEDIRNASTIIKEDKDCTEDIRNASAIIKEDSEIVGHPFEKGKNCIEEFQSQIRSLVYDTASTMHDVERLSEEVEMQTFRKEYFCSCQSKQCREMQHEYRRMISENEKKEEILRCSKEINHSSKTTNFLTKIINFIGDISLTIL